MWFWARNFWKIWNLRSIWDIPQIHLLLNLGHFESEKSLIKNCWNLLKKAIVTFWKKSLRRHYPLRIHPNFDLKESSKLKRISDGTDASPQKRPFWGRALWSFKGKEFRVCLGMETFFQHISASKTFSVCPITSL